MREAQESESIRPRKEAWMTEIIIKYGTGRVGCDKHTFFGVSVAQGCLQLGRGSASARDVWAWPRAVRSTTSQPTAKMITDETRSLKLIMLYYLPNRCSWKMGRTDICRVDCYHMSGWQATSERNRDSARPGVGAREVSDCGMLRTRGHTV